MDFKEFNVCLGCRYYWSVSSNRVLCVFSEWTEAYSKPSQKSKMELLKSSILDIQLGSEYISNVGV